MSVRRVEVRLTNTEDKVLQRLGYREYEVSILTTPPTVVSPPPKVTNTNQSQLGPDQLESFLQMGGYGNVSSLYTVEISRLFPEALVRGPYYWQVSRDGYVARCLLVSVQTLDSRYRVILGVLKDG